MPLCILQRIKSMIGRGTLVRTDENPKMRTAQIEFLKGDVRDGLEHFEPYGISSRPKPGAEALAVFFGGDRSHGVIVSIADRQYRLKLEEGEVALWDDLGQKVHLKRDGISVETGLNLTAQVGGNVTETVSGNVTATVSGSVELKASNVKIDAPVVITKTLTVEQQIVGQGGMSVSGGSGASVSGSLAVTGGDVTADDISLKSHTHTCPDGKTGPAE